MQKKWAAATAAAARGITMAEPDVYLEKLSAFSRIKLDVMDLSTYRNLRKREAVSYSYFGICTVHNCHSVFQSFRSKDICFFSVCVADQRNVCRSVRIVFDTYYCCRDSVFLSLEVYDSIFFLSAAAAMSYSNLTLCVTTCFSFFGIKK